MNKRFIDKLKYERKLLPILRAMELPGGIIISVIDAFVVKVLVLMIVSLKIDWLGRETAETLIFPTTPAGIEAIYFFRI
jgi:hypothetical protein